MNRKTEEYKKAVALNYDHQGAPKVTAQGQGLIAEQIIRLAQENEIH
ncbi:MAG: EscU/YscU/HrcU family type III secretion system export apparatus switch protein, partial [Amphritea sp.]|nr:EscU/YscU/HrcU family type III secretion system export apparatus switch protein [Amphritea sp.]MBQ0783347.1 EscU/YscU/HrcU family type III secretion system export apparatus switch protein [Amphritea sp.]